MLALEFDGVYWHRHGVDKKRDAELTALGWDVRHFSELEEAERAICRI
jgi:very-short-patch-repair endonuclease